MSAHDEQEFLRKAIIDGARRAGDDATADRVFGLAAKEVWAAGWRRWPYAAGLADAVLQAAKDAELPGGTRLKTGSGQMQSFSERADTLRGSLPPDAVRLIK